MVSSEGSGADGGTTSGVAVAPDVDGPGADAAVGPEYASWGQRVLAALLDDAILAGVTWLALGVGFAPVTLTPVFAAAGTESWARGPIVLVPVAALVALLVLQALTGWTPGKLVAGIRVVREDEHRPAGLGRTLARWVLHVLDAVLLIGYLRPIWHAKRQTFADGIVRTVVVREALDLPRRPRIAVYSAAMVVCVLGLGYGCVPISSGSTDSAVDESLCEVETTEPTFITGEIKPAGSVLIDQERRMWTVRETRTVRPGATITWTSDPSARQVDYRVELDARRGQGEERLVSRSWDVGSGDLDSWTDNEGFTHARTIAADRDQHDVQVDITDPGADAALAALGDQPWIDVRLLADGDVVASCGGPAIYTGSGRVR